MADTASLVARVKTDGAEVAAKQLGNFAGAADSADAAVNKLTPDVAKVNAATSKAASEGFSKFRNAAGQVGFQVQDMVVQLQSGTSAFVAIGQQGSQLAGAFGPGGAVLGAVIALGSAVGGVLYKSLNSSKSSLEDVEKGANNLNSSFSTAKDGTIELSDAMVALSQNGDLAYGSMVKLVALQAQQQLQNTTNAIKTQSESWLDNSVAGQTAAAQLDEMIKKNQDVGSVLSNVNVVADASSGIYANLAAQVNDIGAQYGLTTKQVSDLLVAQRGFNAQPTAANAQKIADTLTAAAQAATENKKELLDQAVSAQQLANALRVAENQLDAASAAQKRNGAAVNSTTKAYQDQTAQIIRNQQIANLSDKERAVAQANIDKEAFAKRKGVTEEQIKAYNAARDQEAAQDIARINATEQKKTDTINAAAARRSEAAAKRAETEAEQQKKAAANFIAGIQRQNEDELKAIDAQEQQKLERLAAFREQGAVSDAEYEATKTQIAVDAEAARQEEIAKRRKEAQDKQQKGEDFITQIAAQNATELELLDIQEQQKLAVADKYRQQGLINEDQHAKAVQDIQENYNKKRSDQYSTMLGETTDNLKTALGEGNALYKAAAITETVINTYKAATAAYSALAPVPIIGPALGVAAAAAATAAGLATVGKIRSAREQGGNLAYGQLSTIAERGRPEVIMPAGASRVRTAQQMRQIMGENGSQNNGTPQISIINQTSGRIDSVEQEQDDEGRLTLLIREVVSGDLQDSNSRITKSRRATRGQPGFA